MFPVRQDPTFNTGQAARARGGESLFTIHVRARQMLRKLNRRDTKMYPPRLEFRFVDQKQSSIRQSIAYTKGDTVVEMMSHIWDRYSIIAVDRDAHVLEYTYLRPVADVPDEETDGLVTIV